MPHEIDWSEGEVSVSIGGHTRIAVTEAIQHIERDSELKELLKVDRHAALEKAAIDLFSMDLDLHADFEAWVVWEPDE